MCDLRITEYLETTKKGRILTIGSNLNIQNDITDSLQTGYHNDDNILFLILRCTFFIF